METCNKPQVFDVWESAKRNKKALKSAEIIENILQEHGLSKNESKVYLHLALSKERKAGEISEALKLHRTDTYRTLQDLEKKGLVSSVFEKPLKFIATPFDRALDALIEAKRMRIQSLERKKETLMTLWKSLPKPEIKDNQQREVFQILDGEEQINLKASEIIQNAQKEIKMYTSEDDLPGLYHSGLIETLEKLTKKKIDIKFLTVDTAKSHFFAEKMKRLKKRVVPSETDVPSFILTDQNQLIFVIRKTNGSQRRKKARHKIAALWTNYEAFIKALGTLFNELWDCETK